MEAKEKPKPTTYDRAELERLLGEATPLRAHLKGEEDHARRRAIAEARELPNWDKESHVPDDSVRAGRVERDLARADAFAEALTLDVEASREHWQAYVAAAVNALPALLDRLEALESVLEAAAPATRILSWMDSWSENVARLREPRRTAEDRRVSAVNRDAARKSIEDTIRALRAAIRKADEVGS